MIVSKNANIFRMIPEVIMVMTQEQPSSRSPGAELSERSVHALGPEVKHAQLCEQRIIRTAPQPDTSLEATSVPKFPFISEL